MLLALAQTNPVVGDLAGNLSRLLVAARNARDAGATLLVTPELALCGYPPRDLLERPAFVRDCLTTLARLIESAPLPMVVGAVVSAKGDPLALDGGPIANAAVVVHHGSLVACHRKQLLPNYDIFDEPRYFSAGSGPTLLHLGEMHVALTVCEDVWNDKSQRQSQRYAIDPVQQAVDAGAQLIINLSASPFDRHKPVQRLENLRRIVEEHRCPLVYCNQVGGNDGTLFDGRSLALNADGSIAARAPAFLESLTMVSVTPPKAGQPALLEGELAAEPSCWEEDITQALCMGLSDYLAKTGFDHVLLGLSGGIDSAVVAALAVRALGAQKVVAVAMPSKYSSQGSLDDARALADALRIRLDVIPIEPMVEAFSQGLAGAFKNLPADITEENLQSRVRGVLLMAYSNKFGGLLLTTGNKSETAVGYCTLYGDMNGSLGLISDLYKTEVYAIAHHLNATGKAAIPQSTLTKAPSAELRAEQKDSDSLPAYEELDAILRGYVDEARSQNDLVAQGFDAAVVTRCANLVAKSEYKRRQMAPGLRVSRKAFGDGRRLPLAQRWGF